MSLVLIKLQNGTEILGDVVLHDEQKIEMRDPFQINYKHLSFQPMPSMSISRYMPFAADSVFQFYVNDILHAVTPKQSVVDYYEYVLKNYQENIDPLVDSELQNVSQQIIKPRKNAASIEDAYKTLLERAENDGPLN